MDSGDGLHVAVALDGTGFHPASWRHASARPAQLSKARYWADLARTAERGLLDLLTIEDSFGLQSSELRGPDGRTDQVRGRLDAVLIASLMAPLTRHIGLVPTALPRLTEPFHLASAFATLDYASRGRAGWRVQVAGPAAEVGDRFGEATDAVEVVRQLWDSWEDDAVIKDVATGRYIDRDKLHHIDFQGRFFAVKGPSIVPRPPQGNPLVVALAHGEAAYEFAALAADVVVVTPADHAEVRRRIADVRTAERAVGRAGPALRILADLVVFLDVSREEAAQRKRHLDELDGAEFHSDAATFIGTPEELADELVAWSDQGLDGFRLRPGVIGHDLDAIVDGVVPALQQRGAFRSRYRYQHLRERFGLLRQPSRYAAART